MQDDPQAGPVTAWWKILLVGRNPRRTLVRLVILALVTVGVFKYLLLPVRIAGRSMAPTYRSGGINLVNRWAYLRVAPKRGDVVAVRMAGPSVMLLKRIVGLPGETVAIRQGMVHIDGRPLDEPYVKLAGDWNVNEFRLGAGDYFLVGDNRSMNQQEHTFGVAPRGRIAGKVLF